MQIAIFGGTGSLGAYFAHRLVRANHNVTIIGRENSPNLKQIAEIGLTMKFHNETLFTPSANFTYVAAYDYNALTMKQDLVIVSLKQPSFDIKLAREVMNITDDHSVIGVISNGLPFYFLNDFNLNSKIHIESVDKDGEISQLMQARKVITIMPIMGANVESPGVIKVVNKQDKIKTFIGGKVIDQGDLELISQMLDNALIPNIISDNISKKFLEKLQFSLAVNVMSALLDQHNGQVFQSEQNQNYVRYVVQFVNSLAKALGIDDIRGYDAFRALNISEARYSSMHEDFSRGKMPEVKVIVSAPLELSSYFNLAISTKPIELVEELLLAKSNNIPSSSEQIQEIYYEAELALNTTEVVIDMSGEDSDLVAIVNI